MKTINPPPIPCSPWWKRHGKSFLFTIMLLPIFFMVAVYWTLSDPEIIREHFYKAYHIPSGAMKPTLQIGDHILVDRWIDKKGIQRGDIIVFRFPKDEQKEFVKRVVGIQNDVIELREKQLYVNGEPAKENYIVHSDGLLMAQRDNMPSIKVPPNSFFVMGDNRDNSHDSRFWGFVRADQVIGRVKIIYWSWDKNQKQVRWERIGKKVL